MGKNSKLIISVIPKTGLYAPLSNGDYVLNAFIHLSPRLPDSGYLKEYYEFLHWPIFADLLNTMIANSTLRFDRYHLAPNTQLPGQFIIEPDPNNPVLTAVGISKPNRGHVFKKDEAKKIWDAMGFNETTPVSGWILNTAPFKILGTIAENEILRVFKDSIDQTIYNIERNWESRLDEMERKGPLRGLGVGKNKLLKNQLITELRRLKGYGTIDAMVTSSVFTTHDATQLLFTAELLENFKTIIKKRDKLIADQRIQLEHPDELTARNKLNTDEFHKRLSIIAQTPELLKKSGWLYEMCFTIPAADVNKIYQPFSSGQRIYTLRLNSLARTVDTEHMAGLFDEIEFLYTNTCFEFSSPCTGKPERFFSYMRNPLQENYMKIENGFVVKSGRNFVQPNGSTLNKFVVSSSSFNKHQFLAQLADSFAVTTKKLKTSTPKVTLPIPGEGIPVDMELKTAIEKIDEYTNVKDEASLTTIADTLGSFKKAVELEAGNVPEEKQKAIGFANEVEHEIKSSLDFLRSLARARDDLHSNGIAVHISSAEESVRTQTQNPTVKAPGQITGPITIKTKPLNGKIELSADLIVFGHNLDAGYRVDVMIDDDDKKIYSLNRVDAIFDFKHPFRDPAKYNRKLTDPNYLEEHEANDSEYSLHKPFMFRLNEMEPWLGESAQGSNSGALYVDEELFRWNNWSLVCPVIGNHTHVDEKEENPDNAIYNLVKIPVHNSLPPLRFGKGYSFRLRLADMCGGGWAFTDIYNTLQNCLVTKRDTFCIDDNNAKYWTDKSIYYRQEPVQAPMIFDGNKNANVNSDELLTTPYMLTTKGEGPESWVIRSYFNSKTGRLVCKEEAKWFLAPPQISLHLAMAHGVLDAYLKDPHKAVALFKVADKEFGKHSHHYRVGDDASDSVDYLVDPLVESVAMQPTTAPTVGTTPSISGAERYWRKYAYTGYILREKGAANNDPNYTPIEIEQGKIEGQSIYCNLSKEAREFYEPFGLKPTSTATEIAAAKLSAAIRKIKQREIRLIHAVQKPCLTTCNYTNPDAKSPRFKDSIPFTAAITRQQEQSTATVILSFAEFPTTTTDKVTQVVHYYDLQIDHTSETGYRMVPCSKILHTGFEPLNSSAKIFANEKLFKTPAGVQEQGVSFEEVYDFKDCRHIKVFLDAEIQSRFAGYYHENLAKHFTERPFSILGQLENADTIKNSLALSGFEVNGKEKIYTDTQTLLRQNWISIPSTTRPQPIVVDRIVPLIKWVKDGNNKKFTRECNKVRIYFRGDWYSSGEGEQLAIFYQNKKNDHLETGNLSVGFTSNPLYYTNIISQVSEDATAAQILLEEKTFTILFTGAAINPTQNTVNVAKLQYKPTRFTDKDDALFKAHKHDVNFALVNVQFSKPDKEFFADVEIAVDILDGDGTNFKLENLYFPFLKLGLARYQQNAVTEEHRFSEVMVTDYFQLLPKREIEIIEDDTSPDIAIHYKPLSMRKREPGSSQTQHSPNLGTNVLVVKKLLFNQGFDKLDSNTIPLPPLLLNDVGQFTITLPKLGSDETLVLEEYEVYENDTYEKDRRLVLNFIYGDRKVKEPYYPLPPTHPHF